MRIEATDKLQSYRASVFASAYKIDALDAKNFKSGQSITVKDDVGDELIAAGLATRCAIQEVKKKQGAYTAPVADKGDKK